MVRVGGDISERLDIVPAEFFVHRHIYGKWACRCCQCLVQEAALPQIIDGGMPAAGLVAHVNCSPKGLDVLRILDATHVAYLDLTGSGAETIAHLRENGRIVFMFCAFIGPPKIVRLHGQGSVVTKSSADWDALRAHCPDYPAARSIIRAEITRVSDSCGYGVPKLEFKKDRDAMQRWAATKGVSMLPEYRKQKNSKSIDGLPALDEGDT